MVRFPFPSASPHGAAEGGGGAASAEGFSLSGGELAVGGVALFSGVPGNVTLSSFDAVCGSSDAPPALLRRVRQRASRGGFLGFTVGEPSDRATTSLGSFTDRRFLSIFRFKTWWSTMWTGKSSSDLQMETQWLLLEVPELSSFVVVLPLIEGSFRAALHPAGTAASAGEVLLCAESGSTRVTAASFRSIAYLHVCDNPYNLMREAFAAARVHLNSFRLAEEKPAAPLMGKFGWCTWDAFYLTVDPAGVWSGLESFVAGGAPPRFVIIDDGWQSVKEDDEESPPGRALEKLREKMNPLVGAAGGGGSAAGGGGLKGFVKDLRKRFPGVEDIYMWHALCGAWGGVKPGATHLEATVINATVSPGLEGTMEDLAVVKIVDGGVGLVRPELAAELYESMHSHLAESGITGVKVDVIHTLEYLCEEHGGRVELARRYYEGLTRSLAKNFAGTGLLASMQQCNDFFFLGTRQIALGRAGDDFWFQDPNGDPLGAFWLQGVHMVHCAYNSLWMGQILLPDWDMFQSDHLCAVFHAASRAISGGPVYVSDAVGSHDFTLLQQLVFPDGTNAHHHHHLPPPQKPKIPIIFFLLPQYGGVVGTFNCQGGGWDPEERRIRGYPHCYKPVAGGVHVSDVEWDQAAEAAGGMGSAEEYAVYLSQQKKLLLSSPKTEPIEITLLPSSFEIFTLSPVRRLHGGARFAAVGLAGMFNSGGAILEMAEVAAGGGSVRVKVKGGGTFLAFSSEKPREVSLNGLVVGCEWLAGDGKLTVRLPWKEEDGGVSDLSFTY
ncbi:unnamed protein product [Spirodela intermedia]|uniref:galactinol--sucrose galactosyltransferase n=1 Tax=Spirodela intermedia TaxID=51605 RepID=A0A7I8I873_SPIIN|nr:unnamed protein product [Spirodela intermedia]CAA6653856.1 unnamed protein product [Spirodela intermedia]